MNKTKISLITSFCIILLLIATFFARNNVTFSWTSGSFSVQNKVTYNYWGAYWKWATQPFGTEYPNKTYYVYADHIYIYNNRWWGNGNSYVWPPSCRP